MGGERETEMGCSSFSHSQALPFLLLILLQLIFTSYATLTTNVDYIRSSCNATLYPKLCYNSLSIYATNIKGNPKALAATALNLTFSATNSTAAMIKRLSNSHSLGPREAAAMADCVAEVGSAVDELKDSMTEMNHPPAGEDFALQMSDIQTWVSAALTDEDTCMDGFGELAVEGDVKVRVGRRIRKVARLTSNALALINNYAQVQRQGSYLP